MDALRGVLVVPHSPAIYGRTASSLFSDAVDMLPRAAPENWQVVLQKARNFGRNSGIGEERDGEVDTC